MRFNIIKKRHRSTDRNTIYVGLHIRLCLTTSVYLSLLASASTEGVVKFSASVSAENQVISFALVSISAETRGVHPSEAMMHFSLFLSFSFISENSVGLRIKC